MATDKSEWPVWLQDAKTMTAKKILRGEWMYNGYRDGRGSLHVLIDNGRVYEEDPMHAGRHDGVALSINSAGEIGRPGAEIRFLPDDGEIERIGIGDLLSQD